VRLEIDIGGAAVTTPQNGNDVEKEQISWDSLNTDVLEPTGGTIDTTIRPMRESLRKRLKQPSNGEPSPGAPTDNAAGPQQ
jgi:hypothetical protein